MINNNLIATFNSEKEFKETYPKTFYWSLKDDVFKVYWKNFCDYSKNHNINIRSVVFKEVDKMLKCKTSELGYSIYKCPNCHKTLCVHNTCKSRFCNSCGVKYSKQRTNDIISRLIDVPPSFAVDLNLNTTLTQLSTAIFYVKFLYFLVVQLVYNVI